MSRIGVFCTDGVEEVECLTVVDFCRRAGTDVLLISVTGRRQIMGSHQIRFFADVVFEDVDFSSLDAVVLPGGAGTQALDSDEDVKNKVAEFYDAGKLVAAICAAPGILARIGILNGKKATAYPGFEVDGTAAIWTTGPVERDGNVITANGAGATGLFAVAIIAYLAGEEKAAQIFESVMMPR